EDLLHELADTRQLERPRRPRVDREASDPVGAVGVDDAVAVALRAERELRCVALDPGLHAVHENEAPGRRRRRGEAERVVAPRPDSRHRPAREAAASVGLEPLELRPARRDHCAIEDTRRCGRGARDAGRHCPVRCRGHASGSRVRCGHSSTKSRSRPKVSSSPRRLANATASATAPTAIPLPTTPSAGFASWKTEVRRTTAPRTKFGTVVVAVARMFVPNCSDAIVTKTAQYPVAIPSATHTA